MPPSIPLTTPKARPMALRVEFCCAHCKARLNFDLGESEDWVCPSCKRVVGLPEPGESGGDTYRIFDGDPPAVRSSPRHYRQQ